MNKPIDLEHQRFLRDWQGFIDNWIHKVVVGWGGSNSDADDARQTAYLAAYEGFLRWRQLPPDKQTRKVAGGLVGRAVKDAVMEEWAKLRGVPRNSHQRGAGVWAEILESHFEELATTGRGATRVEVMGHALVAYHFVMEGLLHGSTGLTRADTKLLRDEVRDRIHFAVDRLQPEEARLLIEGRYFEGRSFKEVGAELGITSASRLTRLHKNALRQLFDEMVEFASALSTKNTGGSLDDDDPSGDLF